MPIRSDLPAQHVSLITLSPLLGATTSLATTIGLCVTVLGIVIISESLRLTTLRITAAALQTATAILVWTGAVVAADLALQAGWPQMHRELGVFLPALTVTGLLRPCLRTPGTPWAFCTGSLLFCAGALVLGAAREWLGLLSSLPLLPPGAFILAGLLLAAGNAFRPRKHRP